MKKSILIILLVCLSICLNISPLGQKSVFAATMVAQERPDILKDIISSTENQFFLANKRMPKNADELISYANFLSKGNAIAIWDNSFDNDEISGNNFSEDRILADGNYILFQTKADADNQTDTLISYDINAATLENITDRLTKFDLLDQMDKIKNDDILQDGFGHTVNRSVFNATPSIKILLRNNKFEIIGSIRTPATTKTNINKISVEKVTINEKSISLKKGEKYQLAATVIPYNALEQRVRWSSDNNGIASVDQYGDVTAKKAGKVKLTATTVDGKKTDICQVTVNDNIKSTSVVQDSKTLKPDNYKVGKTSTLYCAAAYGTLTWVSSNTDIVSILSTNGQYCTIKCLKTGTATIIAYVHSSELLYDPVLKIFIRQPKIEDYVHYNINISK